MSKLLTGSRKYLLVLGSLWLQIAFASLIVFGFPNLLSGQSVCCGQSYQEKTYIRAGVTVGGIGKMGLTLELRRDNRSVNFNLATFSQSDLGMAVTLRQYFGATGGLSPFAGFGLWGAKQFSNDPEEIDRNEMNGKIYIKPTRALEYIFVEFLITPTGASFEDV